MKLTQNFSAISSQNQSFLKFIEKDQLYFKNILPFLG